MIKLDFFSGSHGHFLEYVINTWVFKGPKVNDIFTDLGTSHNIRKDVPYTASKIIHAGHYSEFDRLQASIPSKVVQITITEDWAKWIYQINVMARAGDIPMEKKVEQIPDHIRQGTKDLRRVWYSKFNFDDNSYTLPGNWIWGNVPSFKFNMESLFDLENFYRDLYRLAEFLETTFVPDRELGILLTRFLDLNQGWQYYSRCKNLYLNSLTGNNIEFSSDEILQALLNSMISRSIGVFDGKLFEDDSYPSNTNQVWKEIEQHLFTFDQRF